MAKTKVFISHDFDNDKTLKDFIIGQAKLGDSPFDVQDHSLKEEAPEKEWEKKARAAIGRSEKFIVMLGPKTKTASGVKKEVAFAKEWARTASKSLGIGMVPRLGCPRRRENLQMGLGQPQETPQLTISLWKKGPASRVTNSSRDTLTP